MLKNIKLVVTALVLLTSAGVAHAADCQYRNVQFVGTTAAGDLVVNAEVWNSATGVRVGNIANTSLCRITATMNGVTPDLCKVWQSSAVSLYGLAPALRAPTVLFRS